MDLFESDLQFSKIIFRNKFYYPSEINAAINEFVGYLNTNSKQSNSPFIYLFAANHIKTVIAYFAIIKSNRICVLVDPEIKKLELGEMKQDTPPYAMIKFEKETDTFDFQKEVVFTGNNIDIDSKEIEDVCTIAYTNAEDGFAKGAMLTKKNILSNAKAILDCDKIVTGSVCCGLVPFNHLYGLQTGVLAPLLAGESLLISDITNLKEFKKIVHSLGIYKVTNIYSIPIIYHLISKCANIDQHLSTATTIVSGGYKLHSDIFKNFLKKSNKFIRNGYGLTEASPICTWHRPDDPVKIESIGRAFSHCDVKILDDNGIELQTGQTAEICVKGDNVMKGYYNNPITTEKTLKNGWLHTGDLGAKDEDHYFYYTGLKKQMLNSAGNNVYPAEVERLIKQHPNVFSVKVTGKNDDFHGHYVIGTVKLKDNDLKQQAEFKKWCFENISYFKIPRVFIFN